MSLDKLVFGPQKEYHYACVKCREKKTLSCDPGKPFYHNGPFETCGGIFSLEKVVELP